MKSRETGAKGEDAAVKKLKKLGYKIIERNFYSRLGEIDIIARDKEYIVFVEVHYRQSVAHGSGAETIDFRKQRKLTKTAELFLQKNNALDYPARFDVASISGDLDGKLDVEVIQNAFEARF